MKVVTSTLNKSSHILLVALVAVGTITSAYSASKTTAIAPSVKKAPKVDIVYHKQLLEQLTDGSRYGANKEICHEALMNYYTRKEGVDMKQVMFTIGEKCTVR